MQVLDGNQDLRHVECRVRLVKRRKTVQEVEQFATLKEGIQLHNHILRTYKEVTIKYKLIQS